MTVRDLATAFVHLAESWSSMTAVKTVSFPRFALATADVDVLEAESIGQALEISEQENPDCILLDNRLSGDSGFSFLERVCQEPHVPKFPVVF